MGKKYSPETHKYVAVDFDGTIIEEGEFPYIHTFLPHAIDTLNLMKQAGYEIMIWTCRGGNVELSLIAQEPYILRKLAEEGLDITGIKVNRHFEEYYEKYKGNSPKIYADVYIDNSSYGLVKVDWLEIREAFI